MKPSDFFKICSEAQPPSKAFASLYRHDRWYGGPEEGGWYGSTHSLVASQQFADEATAEAAVLAMGAQVSESNEDERRRNGEACLASMEWLDARGLDADFLPPPDGDTSYFAVVEEVKGSQESSDSRHYC